jgi:hypothetical protein
VFFLAIVSTLINPFGIGIYIETFRHFGNPMQDSITEWEPIPLFSDFWWLHMGMGVLVFFGILRVYATGEPKENIPSIFFAGMFFILSLWARRYAWPAYYIVLPLLSPLARSVKPGKKTSQLFGAIALLTATCVFVLIVKFPFSDILDYSWDRYCQRDNVACSPRSADFLLRHHLTQDLFSDYDWGGWLIWNYPDIKPTIDGRMAFWEDEDGYSGYKEYLRLEQNVSDIDRSEYAVVYMSPKKPIYKRMEQLVKEGKWELVYHDSYAGIFVRTT